MTTVTLTDSELREIRGRVEAATPGPWEWDDLGNPDGWQHLGPDLVTANPQPPVRTPAEETYWSDFERRYNQPEHSTWPRRILSSWGHDADGLDVTDADAAFIAHAREDVPRLLDEIERLQAQVRVLRQAWLTGEDDQGYCSDDDATCTNLLHRPKPVSA